ncbi:MAG: hypothetical protein NZ696_02730 [Thermomicrobium sp.]|nr:hypothetical protein [Thermomicrobium sp.]MDW7982738.1 hypothetical protein [Thermomicrobium sp.]
MYEQGQEHANVIRRWTENVDMALDERADWRRLAWWFGGIVIGFKTWTLGVILVFSVQWSTAWFLLLNHLAWVIAFALLIWGPLLFWYRLVRVRRRRHALLRSEWEISEPSQRWR